MNPMLAASRSPWVDHLHSHLPDHMMRLDREAAPVAVVESWILGALRSWQREQVEMARAMATDEGSRFVESPSRGASHERQPMGPFVRSLANADAASRPWDAMRGLGGFLAFKDAPEWLALLEAWHA